MTKAQIKRRIKKIIAVFLRIRLKNKTFSIISNNCWGGVVYDKYGLKYLSPTIGCYFYAEDFLKFCENLKYYLSLPIKMISLEESKYKDELIKNNLDNNPLELYSNEVIRLSKIMREGV